MIKIFLKLLLKLGLPKTVDLIVNAMEDPTQPIFQSWHQEVVRWITSLKAQVLALDPTSQSSRITAK